MINSVIVIMFIFILMMEAVVETQIFRFLDVILSQVESFIICYVSGFMRENLYTSPVKPMLLAGMNSLGCSCNSNLRHQDNPIFYRHLWMSTTKWHKRARQQDNTEEGYQNIALACSEVHRDNDTVNQNMHSNRKFIKLQG
uniref:Uncharacterized protein n=1 Tax=Opuntia streptacantha TaxID=393608 RepID=A0A7C9CXR5_OPUST